MKNCNICGKKKLVSEFWKDKSRSDGYAYRCKSCERVLNRKKGLKNFETRKNRNKRYYQRHKKEISDKRKKYLKLNPRKVLAREAVKQAIQKGILIRPEFCERCGGKRRIVAHHDNYSKPLKVEWICSPCHMLHHWGK